MKQESTFSFATIGPALAAQDYHRGWEMAQKEYLRQEKRARLKPTTRRLPLSSRSFKLSASSYPVYGY